MMVQFCWLGFLILDSNEFWDLLVRLIWIVVPWVVLCRIDHNIPSFCVVCSSLFLLFIIYYLLLFIISQIFPHIYILPNRTRVYVFYLLILEFLDNLTGCRFLQFHLIMVIPLPRNLNISLNKYYLHSLKLKYQTVRSIAHLVCNQFVETQFMR